MALATVALARACFYPVVTRLGEAGCRGASGALLHYENREQSAKTHFEGLYSAENLFTEYLMKNLS